MDKGSGEGRGGAGGHRVRRTRMNNARALERRARVSIVEFAGGWVDFDLARGYDGRDRDALAARNGDGDEAISGEREREDAVEGLLVGRQPGIALGRGENFTGGGRY
eukprot:scaffold49382_cov28-Tisochrysis_lutea.AAC.5